MDAYPGESSRMTACLPRICPNTGVLTGAESIRRHVLVLVRGLPSRHALFRQWGAAGSRCLNRGDEPIAYSVEHPLTHYHADLGMGNWWGQGVHVALPTVPTALPISSTRFLNALHLELPAWRRVAWSLWPSIGALSFRKGLATAWRYTVCNARNIYVPYKEMSQQWPRGDEDERTVRTSASRTTESVKASAMIILTLRGVM